MGLAKLDIRVHTDEYALAFYGPVLLQLWQRSSPLVGAQEACRLAGELARAGHERTGSLVIVPVDSEIPGKDAREELTQVPIKLKNGAGLVLVQEGTGFRASAVRAVLSTIMLISRQTMPHDVVPTVAQGVGWLDHRLSIPGGSLGLVTAIRQLRALYEREELSRMVG